MKKPDCNLGGGGAGSGGGGGGGGGDGEGGGDWRVCTVEPNSFCRMSLAEYWKWAPRLQKERVLPQIP